MTDGDRARAYSDIAVLVVSTSAVLSAAMAAGLAAIGWPGARPVVTRAWAPAARPSEAPTVVFVADEAGVLPEPSLVFSDDAHTVVVIAPRKAAVSLLPMCERGATVVDGDLPLQAQLRAVDLALGGRPSIHGSAVGLVRSWAEDLHLVAGLTRREGEVLDLIMCGDSADVVAERLFLSVSTVRSHIRSILQKFQVPSQLAAAAIACRARCAPGHRRCQSRQF